MCEPTFGRFFKVDAQAERAIIDACQLAIAEEAMLDGVDELFVVHLKKFPFADSFNAFHLRGRKVDVAIFHDGEAGSL